MKDKVSLKPEHKSKVFRSMLRSALIILLLPILVSIALSGVFLYSMEKEAEGFREIVLGKVVDEVNREFRAAYQLINTVKNTEVISSYARAKERDYWTEFQIYKFMNKVLLGSNLEKAYLYFPQYEFVFSETGGVESKYFQKANYEGSYEEWQETLEGGGRSITVRLQGKDLKCRNLMISNVLNNGSQELPVVIAVQLKNKYMNQLASDMLLEGGDRMLIYNSNGVIGSSFDSTAYEELAELLQAVDRKEGGSIHYGGITYDVRVRYSSQYGLTAVYASPKDMIHSSFTFIRVYAFAAVGFCIVFSILLCLAVTNRNYRPIQRLFGLFREAERADWEAPDDYEKIERCINDYISRNKSLLSTISRYEEDYKEIYLEKILYGRIHYLEGIEKSGRLCGLGLEAPWFAVILYEFEEPALEEDFDVQSEAGSREVLRDSLSAYIEEKMEYITRFYILEGENGYIGVLNGEAASSEMFADRIERDNRRILQEMEAREEICCESFCSSILDRLDRLHEGYEQVMRKREEEEQDAEHVWIDSQGGLRVDRVTEMVHEQMTDPNLSVAAIADAFQVSPSHLSRFFKQQMGMGLLDYIHRCRIDMAKELMKKDASIRVKEVAERTGFYNVSAFIRVFKKTEDMTPGQYREKL